MAINQQIAGVMQPNVVQSPQVATVPSPIVQPPLTPALPANEQPETQAPSQEAFAVSSLLSSMTVVNLFTLVKCGYNWEINFLVMDIILVFLIQIFWFQSCRSGHCVSVTYV